MRPVSERAKRKSTISSLHNKEEYENNKKNENNGKKQ
jgi:hypothetical protein